ncbi:ATP-binding protein [Paenibacillus harenae]|uniref:ATP-binding protein n=1 Tax=Paenibacillus harenae TaxID=306543 RepID=UPI0004160E62|nr:ATP-binding protein [Paenibacillus harenae]
MIGYLKDFILNIFVIFTPLLMYPYIFKTKSSTLLYRFLLYLLFAVPLIITMSIPVNLNGLIYDFRSIPLAIGSLYGGWQVSLLLYLTINVYRYILGNSNDLQYLAALLPSFVFVLFFLKFFSSMKLAQKIATAFILCTLVKLLTFSIYLTLTGQLELLTSKPLLTVQTYLLQGVFIGLCVYLIELLKNYFYMQEEVFKSEKMKIVGDMAASVAHEIRNPLTTVRGFIHLFGSADLDKEKKEYYKRICFEELDRAELIITDYLSLAKPDPEVVEKININEEVQYLANVLLTYANYNNIQINVNLIRQCTPYIVGDRYKFRQALVNIGKNAIEAMQGGGVLDLRTDKLHGQALIIISDTGHGMTPEQLKRLGTPYYSTKEKGTGLGTMVSFSIIKKMNGKVDMKSELGKGTEFKLLFPVAV